MKTRTLSRKDRPDSGGLKRKRPPATAAIRYVFARPAGGRWRKRKNGRLILMAASLKTRGGGEERTVKPLADCAEFYSGRVCFPVA